MPYTILEHTADVRLLVEGPTLAELFREALRGMMELMKPEGAQPLPASGSATLPVSGSLTEVDVALKPRAQPEVTAPLEAGARGAERPAESQRSIRIESPSATALLVDFLNEALWLAHSHREMLEMVTIEVIVEGAEEGEKSAQPKAAVLPKARARVRAELRGQPVGAFGEDVKAVTYHEAEIRRNAAGGFETRLVFDI